MNKYNMYRTGLYHDIFGYWKKRQIVTRKELVEYTMVHLEKSLNEAKAAVTVILSPRRKSNRGDCRGSSSSNGHLYYAEKLNRAMKLGVREPQRFRLRWRECPLRPRFREQAVKIAPIKVNKSRVVVQAPQNSQNVILQDT